MDLKTTLEEVLGSLKAAAKDLASIEVTTVTGDVGQIITDKKINLPEAINKLNSGETQGTIELIAHTYIAFDQDATQFVKKTFTDNDEKLFELHQSLVKASIESRYAFLKFIQEVIKP
jgi:hypothetical protein